VDNKKRKTSCSPFFREGMGSRSEGKMVTTHVAASAATQGRLKFVDPEKKGVPMPLPSFEDDQICKGRKGNETRFGKNCSILVDASLPRKVGGRSNIKESRETNTGKKKGSR